MSDYNTILVERRGAVTLVTLNRPEALNALNGEVLRELIGVFAAYDADDSQRCLVADRHHQLEVLLVELVAGSLLDDLARRRVGVDVDHAHDAVPPLHRHANRLAHAQLNNAPLGVPSLVVAGVAGEHALLVLHHVVEDRAADRQLAFGPSALAGPASGRGQLARLVIDEHHAAAVAFDPLKD